MTAPPGAGVRGGRPDRTGAVIGPPRPEPAAVNRHREAEIFPGDGEMAVRMRAHDWEASRLGDPATWPRELCTSVALCLSSRFPIVLWWGPDLRLIYNDAYVPALGDRKHPALGVPGREAWSDIWDIIGPQLQGVMETGEATWSTDVLLPMDRRGFVEETYWTYSYSPIHAAGRVAGIFTPCAETTEQVVAERRLRTLHRLGEAVSGRTVEEACVLAAEAMTGDRADIPFAGIYLADPCEPDRARLVADTAPVPGTPFGAEIDLRESAGRPWATAREHGVPALVRLDDPPLSSPVVGGPARVGSVAIRPLRSPTRRDPVAYLVAGISPVRPFDTGYETFLTLVAKQATTLILSAAALADARTRAEELAELDRAKTTFFSNVSHEFRTPLTLLLAPLEEARAGGTALEGEPLDLAHRNGLRLLRLVNTLLDFSRIEAGRAEAVFEPVEIGALTTDLAASFRSVMERGGLALVIDAPPLSDPFHVDRSMWEKIVLNLLSNAFKHTFEGNVRVGLRATDDHAELTVADTGVGIAPEEMPRLFERFHRAPSTRARSHEGTGIGLSLVDELVRQHGGEIEVVSALGEGTAFTVRIPRGVGHLPAERVRREAAPAARSTALGPVPFVEEAARWLGDDSAPAPQRLDPETPPGTRPRILLADDNADMRQYLTRLLGGRFDVEAVGDGARALASALEAPPDLVLSDVMMPGLDGLGLVRALREDPRSRFVPVVLLSARSGEEATIGGLEAGADDYLEKPFSADELLARVNSHIALGRARRDAGARDRLLADASLSLDSALGVDQRLRSVATLLTSSIADMCVMYMREEDGALERAAIAHADPATEEALRAYQGPSDDIRRVADSGRTELIAEVTDAVLRRGATSEADLRLRRRIAPRSFCAVPIAARGEAIGVIALGRSEGAPPFAPADLPVVEELGRRVGIAVDNARLYERARASARVEADRARALAELQSLTAALSEALTPSAVARALIDIGLPLVGAVAGGLMVIDEDERVLRSVHMSGYPDASADRAWRIPVSAATPLTEAIRRGATAFVGSSAEARRRWPAMEGFLDAHGLDGGLAAVPIASGGRVLGALAARYPVAGPLGADGRRLLETVARLAGPALLRSLPLPARALGRRDAAAQPVAAVAAERRGRHDRRRLHRGRRGDRGGR